MAVQLAAAITSFVIAFLFRDEGSTLGGTAVLAPHKKKCWLAIQHRTLNEISAAASGSEKKYKITTLKGSTSVEFLPFTIDAVEFEESSAPHYNLPP